jgi:hypothetical protein
MAMSEKREQALSILIDTFGVDSAAEIMMYVLREKRDTLLLARLTDHLSKAEGIVLNRSYKRYAKKYGEAAANRAFKKDVE